MSRKTLAENEPEIDAQETPVADAGPFMDAPPEPVVTAFSQKSDKADRRGSVSIKFDEQGKPDFDGMKAKQKEKLEQLVSSEEFQTRFQLQPKQFEVDPQMVAGLIDMVGKLQATVFAIKFKIPHKLALEIASYTEDEKQVLLPPSKRVIEKHAPALAAKYGDELVLFGLLSNLTMLKMTACKQIAEQYHKQASHAEQSGKANGEARNVPPHVSEPQPQSGQTV